MSNPHASYALGYTRATMVGTKRSEIVIWSKPEKPISVQIVGCNPPT